MKFVELSDADIKRIVTDIFHPTKITCIRRCKRFDEISCKIYTDWELKDEKGKVYTEIFADELVLRNPFENGDDSIDIDFSVSSNDYLKLKQFCYAKGVSAEAWTKNNPYLTE